MVTFRFYLVSIVAFFLALAVGVVVGSVLDEGISNSLKDRLERVEHNLDDTVAVIDQKNAKIDQLELYSRESEPFIVAGHLDGTSTLVVADSGVDEDQVRELVRTLRSAGSNTPGIVWVDKSWDASSDRFVDRLAAVVGRESGEGDDLEAAVWDEVLKHLNPQSTDGTIPDNVATTTTAGDGDRISTTTSTLVTTTTAVANLERPDQLFEVEVLKKMAEDSLVSLEFVDGDNPTSGGVLNVIAVTGPDSNLSHPGRALAALATQSVQRSLPTVVGEQYQESDDEPMRGALLHKVLDEDLRSKLSTVDDAGEVPGRVAAVLALAQAGSGLTGEFGLGSGVDSVLPPRPRS